MLRARLYRTGLILAALFQLLLPAFALAADARAEAASERGASSHIESHGTPNCVPAHSAACAICRVLSGGASASRAPVVGTLPERVVSDSLPRYHGVAVGTQGRHCPSQRAPPIA